MLSDSFFLLTTKNSDQLIPELLDSPEAKDKSSLIKLLVKATLIRPFSITAYADLAFRAFTDSDKKGDLLLSLLDPDTSYPGTIVMAYLLWEKHLYTSEEITNCINEKYPSFGSYKSRYLFVIFSQLIKERNRDEFQQQCHNFYMTYAMSGFGNIFGTFFQSLPSKTKEEIKASVEAPYGEVGNAIVNDNVDYLKNNNVNPNGTIIPSFFMATDLGQQSPTYLQWAALCGAEQCFHYLIEVGANPQTNDRQGKSALQYAAAGGNLVILRELSKVVPDGDRAKETAIEYENREVFNQI